MKKRKDVKRLTTQRKSSQLPHNIVNQFKKHSISESGSSQTQHILQDGRESKSKKRRIAITNEYQTSTSIPIVRVSSNLMESHPPQTRETRMIDVDTTKIVSWISLSNFSTSI